MSERTAVYRLYAADGRLLYIGVARHFGSRWHQHAGVQPWWSQVDHQTIAWFDTRDAAMQAEASAIKAEHPKYNVVHNGAACDRTGLPADEHPQLGRIRRARSRYDSAREAFLAELRMAIAEGDALPADRRRLLGVSAIARASGYSREHIANLRDGA